MVLLLMALTRVTRNIPLEDGLVWRAEDDCAPLFGALAGMSRRLDSAKTVDWNTCPWPLQADSLSVVELFT